MLDGALLQVVKHLVAGDLSRTGERQGLVEIGDEPHHVRQPGEGFERGASLEIEQEKGHLLRWRRAGEGDGPRDQQLALAAARGAPDHGVRPIGHQVDDERPVGGRADRDGEPVPR